ncbi:hypothetical protein V8G54_024820 [Vigna mungo]|uniref:Tryptophan synthase beta chain-like PALP domain-containing protein n=1 Tax=Vigna mungo TaxID=3915 RepID=A0AAQ3RQH8_VIGMU
MESLQLFGVLPKSDSGGDDVMNVLSYLTNILTSKVYDVAIESPLQFAPKLSGKLGVKIRGAYNMMAKLPRELLEKGVICTTVIVMPVTTPKIKWKFVEALGVMVVLAVEEGRTFILPFDHPDIIMGQGIVGMEFVCQMQGPRGGLIPGIAAYVKRVNPKLRIIGVEPSDANAMALSFHHDQRVILDQIQEFSKKTVVIFLERDSKGRLTAHILLDHILHSEDCCIGPIVITRDRLVEFGSLRGLFKVVVGRF